MPDFDPDAHWHDEPVRSLFVRGILAAGVIGAVVIGGMLFVNWVKG